MKKQSLRKLQKFFLLAFTLVFAFGLAACGEQNGGTTSATQTPSPSVSTATPTLTPSASPSTALLVAYKGNGFTMSYPQGWTVVEHTNGSVTFAVPPRQTIKFLVNVVDNAHGAVTPESTVERDLQLFDFQTDNYQRIATTSTATIGNVTWSQAIATGDLAVGNTSQPVATKIVMLASNYPQATATTKSFLISYQTSVEQFDAVDKAYFQPMLQSFKFI